MQNIETRFLGVTLSTKDDTSYTVRLTKQQCNHWAGNTVVGKSSRVVVSIYADGCWAADGIWNGGIEDCAADLPEEDYDKLDKAIERSIAEKSF